jgi:hypothetical protein
LRQRVTNRRQPGSALVEAMLQGGCTATDTAKIVGGNYVRVFAASVR